MSFLGSEVLSMGSKQSSGGAEDELAGLAEGTHCSYHRTYLASWLMLPLKDGMIQYPCLWCSRALFSRLI